MFKLNLKIAWRNILKYKSYTAINILGLSLGLAGFIFIVLFVNYEKSYDTWDPALNNVYQVQEYSDFGSTDQKAHWISNTDLRLSSIFAQSIPEVKAVTMVNTEYGKLGITIPGKPSFLQDKVRRSDSLFFKVMPFKFIYGNAELAFNKPNSIVLKESLAIKYFGNVNPIGKTITMAGGAWRGSEDVFTVTGVIEEPKTPSILNFEAVYFWRSSFFDVDKEYGSPSEIYVKTTPITNLDQLNATIQKAYLPIKDKFLRRDEQSVKLATEKGNAPVLRLTKLKEVYQSPLQGKSWRETLKPVMLLSVLLLIVAIINFVNLATAQAASRAKEVGVKKVVGAFRKALILQFLTETFIQCLIAIFVSLLLIEVCLPTINLFFNLELSLVGNPQAFYLILQLLAIVIVVAFLAGSYPAIFLSRYKPSEVLKGNFSNGKNGVIIRRLLVGAQFVVAISFIIGILLVNYQLNYLKKRDNGYTSSGLMNVRTFISPTGRNKNDYDRLKKIDGVKYVAYSSAVIGDNWTIAQSFKYKGRKIDMYGTAVGIEGMQALDARLLAGRFFSPNVIADTINNVILNESAAKLFGKNMIGESFNSSDSVQVNVVGVIKDVQVEGFENRSKPAVYVVENDNGWKRNNINTTHKQTSLIRFQRDKIKNVIAELEKMYAEKNEFYPLSYSYVEDDFAATLISHQRFEKMVGVFSGLSLALSLFGLFALAAFVTKQRTKEIAVRKVLGAANTDILLVLNKGYLWMVLVANIIAFPLAYILINQWLLTFAYRINVTPLPFVLAFFASTGITILTVSLQARRAVNANPVKALKYE